MKKIISIMLALMLIINMSFAYTVKITIDGVDMEVTGEPGNVVSLQGKLSRIESWNVISGGVTITDGQFVMPECNVEIEAVMAEATKSLLTVESKFFSRSEQRSEGDVITVNSIVNNDNYSFLNWTATGITLTSSQQTSQTITFTMPANAVTLVANYSETPTPETYTIEYNENEGSGTIASQTKTQGVDLTLTTEKPTRTGYNFLGWSTSSSATSAEYESGGTFTLDANTILCAVWEERTANQDISGANAPVIIDGLTPVNWNGTAWEEVTEANWEYNYNSVATATQTTVAGNKDGAWANALTKDGSLYVWIPRYTYKITSGYHGNKNSWNSLDSAGSSKIEIKFSNGTTDDVTSGATNAMAGYIKHPAFTFGDDELTGIWVAKYEASQGTNIINVVNKPTATNYVAQSKPGVSAWRNISVSKMYEYAYNTFRNADSHLMRNSEWGAVAYLTNAIGRIPYINNNSDNITGIAGNSQDASSSTSTTNSWNTINGVKASTTHNVYGIYDLSGGACEFVSAYYTGGKSTCLSGDSNGTYAGVLYTNRNTKYVETYGTAYTSSKTGDAVYETSAISTDTGIGYASWDDDYSSAPGSDSACVFVRGGAYDDSSNTGVFSFERSGGIAAVNNGFRTVLSIVNQ